MRIQDFIKVRPSLVEFRSTTLFNLLAIYQFRPFIGQKLVEIIKSDRYKPVKVPALMLVDSLTIQ